jgi:diphthamide synthase subunit DPH2
MPVMKTAKQILRKDIKKTIALMTPEEKKHQSIFVTEKVSEFLGKTQTVINTLKGF